MAEREFGFWHPITPVPKFGSCSPNGTTEGRQNSEPTRPDFPDRRKQLAHSDADGTIRRQSTHQCITKPPSTLMVWPVIILALDDAKNTAIFATSSGVCQSLSGITLRIFAVAHSS